MTVLWLESLMICQKRRMKCASILKATTVICLATQLHTIATGNLTPSYTVIDGKLDLFFIYAVDISEFVLNKLRDRGTLEVTTIVSNIHDFLFKLTSKI